MALHDRFDRLALVAVVAVVGFPVAVLAGAVAMVIAVNLLALDALLGTLFVVGLAAGSVYAGLSVRRTFARA